MMSLSCYCKTHAVTSAVDDGVFHKGKQIIQHLYLAVGKPEKLCPRMVRHLLTLCRLYRVSADYLLGLEKEPRLKGT